MTGNLQTRNAELRTSERQADARTWRLAHSAPTAASGRGRSDFPFALVIRGDGEADAAAIGRLYELEGRRPKASTGLLLAEVDGEVLAALPLDGGKPVSDPFRPTVELVAMLRLRAEQLHGREQSGLMQRLWEALRGAGSRPIMAPLAGEVSIRVRHDSE